MYEACWNSTDRNCGLVGCADTIKDAAGVVLSLSHGAGTIYIFDLKTDTLVKVYKITE